MKTYEQLRKELDDRLCEKCAGRGKLDDAEPGDTYFNEWQCPDCKGTGLKPAQETRCDHPITETVTTAVRGEWLCRKCGAMLRDHPTANRGVL